VIRIPHLVFALLLLSAPFARAGENFERWFIVEVDGHKAGWAREAETRENNFITSTSEMKFSFARMGQRAEVAVATRFVETAAGDAVEMASAQTLGEQEVKETYTFIRGIASYEVMHVTETVSGRTKKTHPWPEGDWKSPAAARRHVAERLAAGEDTVSYSTLDPSVGLTVANITERVIRRDAIVEAAGKSLPAVEWEVTNSLLPGVVGRDFVDERGRALRSEIDFGGMRMVMLASEKEAALSEFAPPEIMARTLVTPTGRVIERPRDAARAIYILSLNDGGDIPDVPSVGAQTAERMDAKRVRVEVVRGRRSEADKPIENPDGDPFLASSAMIDAQDPRVIELAESIKFHWAYFFDDPDAQAGLQRGYAAHVASFVHDFLDDESLGVGFASASEVARTKRGDCTEHAVLTAAILRVKTIGRLPARVVSGLVLVEGPAGTPVFGYHMWTQVRTCGKANCDWFDVDAAIPPARFQDAPDATHIALSTSAMADGEIVNSMASLIGLLGRLRIEVVEVE
jgi:hypothetical protein